MPTTPKYDLPYPAPTDRPSASQLQGLAEGVEEALDLSGGSPIGSVTMYASSTDIPEGWLLCQGQTISRTTYATLYARIGTTYGAGNGVSTFTLPDMRGRTPVGLNADDATFDAAGKSGGAKSHILTIAQMPAHNHGGSTGASAVPANATNVLADEIFTTAITAGRGAESGITIKGSNHNHTIPNQGSGQAHNIMQPYLVMPFIIRAL